MYFLHAKVFQQSQTTKSRVEHFSEFIRSPDGLTRAHEEYDKREKTTKPVPFHFANRQANQQDTSEMGKNAASTVVEFRHAMNHFNDTIRSPEGLTRAHLAYDKRDKTTVPEPFHFTGNESLSDKTVCPGEFKREMDQFNRSIRSPDGLTRAHVAYDMRAKLTLLSPFNIVSISHLPHEGRDERVEFKHAMEEFNRTIRSPDGLTRAHEAYDKREKDKKTEPFHFTRSSPSVSSGISPPWR